MLEMRGNKTQLFRGDAIQPSVPRLIGGNAGCFRIRSIQRRGAGLASMNV
jgi:hypothetical protein